MKKVAILQSNYIPWKGVFDLMNKVDVFVFLEDVAFTKRDWRSRNKIKTPDGEMWLTVPTKTAPRGTKIYEIEIFQQENWQKKHYKSIRHNYTSAPYFDDYHWLLEKIYLEKEWYNLSEFNIYVNKLIAKELEIDTKFINSKNLDTSGNKDDKLIEICSKINANYYLSGPAAKDYISNEKFKEVGIKLAYMKYDYPKYQQVYKPFTHHVTVLDILFNCGPKAPEYIFQGNIEEIKL